MAYIHSLPATTAFDGKGMFGYTFGPLQQKDLDIYYIEVKKGHDTFMISKKITRTYYVLSGSGHFTIANHRYDVGPGMVVEVPPKVEYSYSGKMKLLAFCRPRWFSGNDTHTKWNRDVVQEDLPFSTAGRGGVWLRRLIAMRILGKSPVNAYLRLNGWLWRKLPASFYALGPVHAYGSLLHKLARTQNVRAQPHSTYFLRNRPQLELMRRLVEQRAKTDTLRVAVLGCSTGEEAYSIAWTIRSAWPDLRLVLHAVDISGRAVEVGKKGVYSIVAAKSNPSDTLHRMTENEIEELFDRRGDAVAVKAWIKEGVDWHVGDVAELETLRALGPQDIVVANHFLCHMYPMPAERCLRRIVRLVRPYGYLFVSGIDLDIRTRVAVDLGWRALPELIEEIHEGDACMQLFWPWHYMGLEPLSKKRKDWKLRYASAFQVIPRKESVQGCDRGGDTEM